MLAERIQTEEVFAIKVRFLECEIFSGDETILLTLMHRQSWTLSVFFIFFNLKNDFLHF